MCTDNLSTSKLILEINMYKYEEGDKYPKYNLEAG
jgi:hypothetical protein